MDAILCFTKQTASDNQPLSSDPTELGLRPVEQCTQLEIPVAGFEETYMFQIHCALSTGTMAL